MDRRKGEGIEEFGKPPPTFFVSTSIRPSVNHSATGKQWQIQCNYSLIENKETFVEKLAKVKDGWTGWVRGTTTSCSQHATLE